MTKIKVLYQGKEYTVIFQYDSGFYEIRQIDNSNVVELVHLSELTILD
ncbi:MAG: hypothetical protein ABF649_19785 [Bacillus sp. (in: firmicutes)]